MAEATLSDKVQSGSEMQHQVEDGGDRDEIQSVGELSPRCEKMPEVQRVAKVAVAQSDSEIHRKVEEGLREMKSRVWKS